MKRSFLLSVLFSVSLVIISCAPVLRKEVMETGLRNVSLTEIKRNPDAYKGKLFIFGGVIVNTKVTAEGSLIEALYVPVDSRGHLKSSIDGRFLALFPKESGLLDPIIFRRGRQITLAAEFIEIKEGKLDEIAYPYPFFRIDEIHLWEEQREYYYPYYYDPFYFDVFFFRSHHFRHRRLR